MIRVRQIRVNVKNDSMDSIIFAVSKKLNISSSEIIDLNINKRSIDARHKDNIFFIYEVDINVRNLSNIKFSDDVFLVSKEEYSFIPTGVDKLKYRPIIIGSGPCGLFCAYELAKNGYNPIVFERGEDIDNRVLTVSDFWKNGKLNPNSNVQFGEGGAGTFSDGKLSTQIKDKNNRIREVLNIFVENGASCDILYDFMPHIGTDVLRDVVKNMRNKIISFGGEFRYNSCLTDINISNNCVKSIVINDSEVIDCDLLVLAIGHSARDTFRMLNSKGIEMVSKPFAVGLRVMHSQDMISKNQYGSFSKYLNPASYKLTYNTSDGRGVYSFCMCPGGYVVNASSVLGMTVVNGMSNHDRNSGIANSAIVVSVSNRDYGDGLFDGVEFQEKLEKKAYELGNGLIPVQLYGDYVNHVKSEKFGNILPMLKGNYVFADLNLLFNDDINSAFRDGMNNFNNKITGFNSSDVVLAGIESRTSSPIKILRNDNFESNVVRIFPAGEGAGYAGGIVSAAVDGIKVFESIASRYVN